ncbi:MAG: hypothetical protein PWR01_715 [Clostridiales bacterium]|nr:hypothetical protein [Clostridiales bacterium]
MKSARIVFWLISMLIFAPIVVLNAKAIWRRWKDKQVKSAYVRLALTIIACVLIAVFLLSLYRFTLEYQLPLVMERTIDIFTQRIEGDIDMATYRQMMLDAGLVDEGFRPIPEEDLKQAGFIKGEKYSVAISEQAYDNDGDTAVMYARHEGGGRTIYTAVRFKFYDNKWKALEHRVVSQEEVQKISGIRFIEIRS